jgi:hypothetical protein
MGREGQHVRSFQGSRAAVRVCSGERDLGRGRPGKGPDLGGLGNLGMDVRRVGKRTDCEVAQPTEQLE